MFEPKRSRLSNDMSQEQQIEGKPDTSIGTPMLTPSKKKLKLDSSFTMRPMSRCDEIELPAGPDRAPPEFSVTRNYPEKKWSADVAHIKYRLDNNKDLSTISKDVLERMFQYNLPYLQVVLAGEVECKLRTMFLETVPPHEMPQVVGSYMFGHGNTDALISMMMAQLDLDALTKKNVSGRCYLCMSVLLPELVVKIVQDMYKCDRPDAAKRMRHFSQQLAEATMFF